MGQKLRGLVGQGMNGRRPKLHGYTAQFPPGTHTFTAPSSGRFIFVLWGPGGSSDVPSGHGPQSGGSGAYCEYTRRMAAGETATLVVGAYATASTVTFPDGKVVSAGAGVDGSGVDGAGGTASGGDVNLNGSTGPTNGLGTGGGLRGSATSQSGPGAPANLPYRGGRGGIVNCDPTNSATSPGGGGSIPGGAPGNGWGGVGAAIVSLTQTLAQ